MELSTAIKLIEQGVDKNGAKQKWGDLGAGSGLFTQALSSVLRAGSIIYAIDKNSAVKKVKSANPSIEVKTVQRDFVDVGLGDDVFDGFIMANSLHYVSDKILLLGQLKNNLNASGRLLIVEYDMTTSNQWVPYPIPFVELVVLAKKCGFSPAAKLHEVPSIYHHANIYSTLIEMP
jgi:ubiquinone/menaquinone biosynthesis C-methylase UbiE